MTKFWTVEKIDGLGFGPDEFALHRFGRHVAGPFKTEAEAEAESVRMDEIARRESAAKAKPLDAWERASDEANRSSGLGNPHDVEGKGYTVGY